MREKFVKTREKLRENRRLNRLAGLGKSRKKLEPVITQLQKIAWSSRWRKITAVGVVAVLPLGFFILSASAAVTVDTSTSSAATRYSFQRKTWHDGTRYWTAFYSGSAIEFWYSTDGSSWTQNTNATLAVNTADFSIQASNSTAYIAYIDSAVLARKASSYPGTGFSWGTASTVMTTGGTLTYTGANITRLTNGMLMITCSSDSPAVHSNTSSLADDVTSWNGATVDNATGFDIYSTVVPLAGGEAYASYTDDTSLKGKKYSVTSSSSGPRSVTSSTNIVNDTSVSGSSWSQPGRASASDDSRATNNLSANGTTNYLKATGFGFSIPTGAFVTGITAEFEANSDALGGEVEGIAHIVKGGVIGSSGGAQDIGSFFGDGYYSYGGASSLWSTTWTPTDINSSGFGVALRANNKASAQGFTLEVDHVRITVHYTTGAWAVSATSIGTVTSGSQYAPQLVSNTASDEAYMTFINGSGQTTFQRYIDASGWQTAVTLDSNSGNAYPTITRNTSNGNLHAFWVRSNSVYYKKGVSTYASGNWDTNATSLESSGTNTWITSGENNTGESFVIWTEGTVSPYNVKFAKVSANSAPAVPTLNLPTNNDNGLSTTPQFQLVTTDANSDYLRYEIVIYQSDCSTVVRTIDQTASQTGWSGQNAETSTAYTSGTTAVHSYQSPALSTGTVYCWKARAIDPGGSNTWSSYTSTRTFKTYADFPTTGVLDNFNRSGTTSPPSASWTQSSITPSATLQLSGDSSTVKTTVASEYGGAYWNPVNYGPDSEAYITVTALPAGSSVEITALYVRMVDTSGPTTTDGYQLEVTNAASGNVRVLRMDNGTPTVIGSAVTQSISAGDSLGIKALGNGATVTLEMWYKTSSGTWTKLSTVTDSSASRITTAGLIGVESYDNSTRLDDFGGGPFNVPPGTPSLSTPASGATGVSVVPSFQLSATDVESNYLQYQVVIYQSDCSTSVRVVDQTLSQTGWSGQDANGNTAYASGTAASHAYQTPPLSSSTTYCWRARALDPNGSNSWGAYSEARSFTTASGTSPGASELLQPSAGATGVRGYPYFRLRSSDAEFDYLQYKIEICSTSNCSAIERTIDQTVSQTGWSGQDANGNTAYASDPNSNNSTTASYLLQPPALAANTQYWWRAYAIDPGGSNLFGTASSIQTFTTQGVVNVEIRGGSNIQGGGWIY